MTKEKEEAKIVEEGVLKDATEAKAIADEANAIKTDCETKLAEALPALKAAEEAVNCITKGDIAQLKGMLKPPPDVKNVLMVVCMLKGIQPEIKMNPETQKKEKDFWGVSLKMMMDMGFRDSLINYKKEEMT